MEAKVIDILPKITQWEAIEYAPDFICPDCGKSGLQGAVNGTIEKPYLVGWCETYNGYMAIFECPLCGTKYRWHPHTTLFDLDQFDYCLGAHYIGKNEWNKVKNGAELKKQLDELNEKMKNKENSKKEDFIKVKDLLDFNPEAGIEVIMPDGLFYDGKISLGWTSDGDNKEGKDSKKIASSVCLILGDDKEKENHS